MPITCRVHTVSWVSTSYQSVLYIPSTVCTVHISTYTIPYRTIPYLWPTIQVGAKGVGCSLGEVIGRTSPFPPPYIPVTEQREESLEEKRGKRLCRRGLRWELRSFVASGVVRTCISIKYLVNVLDNSFIPSWHSQDLETSITINCLPPSPHGL